MAAAGSIVEFDSSLTRVVDERLVAKKGLINEWHFAHESGQERPECLLVPSTFSPACCWSICS
jgi:hypothetical protein